MTDKKEPEVKMGKCRYCGKVRPTTELEHGTFWYSRSKSSGSFCNDKPCLQYMNMGGN